MDRPPAASRDLRLYRRILREVRPYWWHLAGIALLSLLSAPLALLLPVPLKLAVDSVIGADPVPDFLAPLVPGVATSPGTNVLLLAVGMLVLVALLQHLQGFGPTRSIASSTTPPASRTCRSKGWCQWSPPW
ncbi:MAG: hypothetical protein ACYTF5_18710 [Planctomycetota bacterium]